MKRKLTPTEVSPLVRKRTRQRVNHVPYEIMEYVFSFLVVQRKTDKFDNMRYRYAQSVGCISAVCKHFNMTLTMPLRVQAVQSFNPGFRSIPLSEVAKGETPRALGTNMERLQMEVAHWEQKFKPYCGDVVAENSIRTYTPLTKTQIKQIPVISDALPGVKGWCFRGARTWSVALFAYGALGRAVTMRLAHECARGAIVRAARRRAETRAREIDVALLTTCVDQAQARRTQAFLAYTRGSYALRPCTVQNITRDVIARADIM